MPERVTRDSSPPLSLLGALARRALLVGKNTRKRAKRSQESQTRAERTNGFERRNGRTRATPIPPPVRKPNA